MEAVLKPFVTDGTIDDGTAQWIRDKYAEMSRHPLIADAFLPEAKVKTECELLYRGRVRRLDRYAELPDAVVLIDYKTGKREEEHQRQVSNYANALREMTGKKIRAYLVYLSEESTEVEEVS